MSDKDHYGWIERDGKPALQSGATARGALADAGTYLPYAHELPRTGSAIGPRYQACRRRLCSQGRSAGLTTLQETLQNPLTARHRRSSLQASL